MAWSLDGVLNCVLERPEKALSKLDRTQVPELPGMLCEERSRSRPDLEQAQRVVMLWALTGPIESHHEEVRWALTSRPLPPGPFETCLAALPEPVQGQVVRGLRPDIVEALNRGASPALRLRLAALTGGPPSIRDQIAHTAGASDREAALWKLFTDSPPDLDAQRLLSTVLPNPVPARWIPLVRELLVEWVEGYGMDHVETWIGPGHREGLRSLDQVDEGFTPDDDSRIWMGPYANRDSAVSALAAALGHAGRRRNDDTGELLHAPLVAAGTTWWMGVPAWIARHASEEGFLCKLDFSPEDEWGAPVGTSIHPLEACRPVLRCGPAKQIVRGDTHPDDGALTGALTEIERRAGEPARDGDFEELGYLPA